MFFSQILQAAPIFYQVLQGFYIPNHYKGSCFRYLLPPVCRMPNRRELLLHTTFRDYSPHKDRYYYACRKEFSLNGRSITAMHRNLPLTGKTISGELPEPVRVKDVSLCPFNSPRQMEVHSARFRPAVSYA